MIVQTASDHREPMDNSNGAAVGLLEPSHRPDHVLGIGRRPDSAQVRQGRDEDDRAIGNVLARASPKKAPTSLFRFPFSILVIARQSLSPEVGRAGGKH